MRPASSGREFLFHIVLTLSLFLSIMFVPLAGFLAGILTPLPTTLALVRYGLPAAAVVPGISGLVGSVVLLLLDMPQSITYLAALLAMGVVLGHGIRTEWSSERIIALSSFVMLSASGLLLLIAYAQTGGELVRLLEQDIQSAIATTLRQIQSPSAETKELEESLLATVPLIVRIMPGITIACTLGISWINVLFARRYFRSTGLYACVQEDWSLWKAPEMLVWGVIACGVALIGPFSALKYPALNALIVIGCVYFLHGLAITSFFLEKWKLPVFLRALVYAILALQQFASMATAIMGMFDMWFDFRKLAKKPE